MTIQERYVQQEERLMRISQQSSIVLIAAVRTRAYAGIPMTLELGGNICNTITSVPKDNYVLEFYRTEDANS